MTLRILIVDDSPAIISQLSSLIGRMSQDAVVVSAHDLTQARNALASLRPDLVFLDIVLGSENNGLKLIWDISRMSPNARIITMSALKRDDPRVEAAAIIGARAHIEKPLRFDDVEAATLVALA